MSGMTKPTMPNVMWGGGGGESTRGRRTRERVKLPRTIAPKDLAPGKRVLHRKTERVKSDDAVIIGSELTNRNKIFDNVWCN
jgi:hypothetical protein